MRFFFCILSKLLQKKMIQAVFLCLLRRSEFDIVVE